MTDHAIESDVIPNKEFDFAYLTSSFESVIKPTTTTIAGFGISAANLVEHIQYLAHCVTDQQGQWVVTLNTEMLAKTSREAEYKTLLSQADLFVADGMPLVWAGNKLNPKHKIEGRTTGVDLVEGLLSEDFSFPYSIIGGVDPQSTIAQYPGALERCKYLFTGKVSMDEEQMTEFIYHLSSNNIFLLFIALGVPKQDKLAAKLKAVLPQLTMIGVGGSFEILSSGGGRAPKWMQNAGLEWLYRLLMDPARLWKRYLVSYPRGVWVLLMYLIQKK